jgi:hypothetical protein
MMIPVITLSQDWGGLRPKGFWDHWSVNANAGVTSYFGDLSYNDSNISGKLTHESGPAYGLNITKHFSKKISLSGQLMYGNIKGGNNRISFETELLHYSMQVRTDFIRLIFPQSNSKFGIEGHAGAGQLLFKAMKTENQEEILVTIEHRTQVPEFIYYFGAGMHYHFAKNFAVTMDMSLQQLQNDRLDDLVKNNDDDYYSYLRIGITYYIDSLKRIPLKNKARLANNTIRN